MQIKFFIISIFIFGCLQHSFSQESNNFNKKKKSTQTNPLAGTWRLISFLDFDSAVNNWVQPYGEHPQGYFTYTKSGVMNLNVSSQQPLNFSADSAAKRCFTIPELLTINGANYFGTYTIDHQSSTVIHHPKGGNIPWYIGTDQQRRFKIKGDTLFIGDPTFEVGKRVLVRVD